MMSAYICSYALAQCAILQPVFLCSSEYESIFCMCASLVYVLYVTGCTERHDSSNTHVWTGCSAPYSTPYHMSPLEEKLSQAVAIESGYALHHARNVTFTHTLVIVCVFARVCMCLHVYTLHTWICISNSVITSNLWNLLIFLCFNAAGISLCFLVCFSSSGRSHRPSIVGVSCNVKRLDVVWVMGWLVAERRSHNLHTHLHGNQLVCLLPSLVLPSFVFNSGP